MSYQLELAPGLVFIATAASVGATEDEFKAMKAQTLSQERASFIWAVIKGASVDLMNAQPQGSC